MSVGFGFSVGDFIAALKLVGIVIDALRETSHASSSFRSLLNELYALESVLLRVKRLDLEDRHNVGELALRQAASQCQHTIDAFWKEIQKYQPHLQQNRTNSRIKDGWTKVKWAVCKKNDLEVFRAQIRGHTSSIELLLMTVQMEATTMDARKQDSHNKSLTSNIQDLSFQVMGKLSAIANSVGQCVQQGKALLESSAQIVQTNLRVFQIVHDIQLFILRIPGQVQRQQPVYLVDAFNRERPFHLEFVRSAEALLAVLKVDFKQSGCDPDMIDRGEFVIEELGTQNSISLSEPWDSCFFPGQKAAMSVIFKRPPTTKSLCPRCGKDCEGSTSQEITCDKCGAIFRRIKEIINEIRDTSQAGYSVDEVDAGDVTERLVNGPPRPPKKRKREEDDARTKVQKFRRIQLLMRDIALVCPECKKEFKRACDLVKHERIHTRPWKCSEEKCKYFKIGWCTENERDRHTQKKHSPAPVQYKCLYLPCTYESKRESNFRIHMEKAHGWEHVRSKPQLIETRLLFPQLTHVPSNILDLQSLHSPEVWPDFTTFST